MSKNVPEYHLIILKSKSKSNHLFQLGHQRGTFKRRIKIKEMGWDGIDSTPIRKGRLYEEEWARNSILTLFKNVLQYFYNIICDI